MASRKAEINLKSKWILIAVVFIVLFAVFYSLYSKQNYSNNQPSNNSSSETADWKKHENTMYNYSIKYPQDWEVEYSCLERSKASSECTFYVDRIKSYPYKEIGQSVPEDANGLIVSIRNTFNPDGLSVKDYASSSYNTEGFGSPYPVSEELIGSSNFVKVDISDKGPNTPSYFIEDPNGNILVITGTITAKNFEYEKIPPTEYKAYINIFNQILSTFRFD